MYDTISSKPNVVWITLLQRVRLQPCGSAVHGSNLDFMSASRLCRDRLYNIHIYIYTCIYIYRRTSVS